MPTDDDLREMAQNSFGYGCWNARYWFIGPEQGMSRNENQLALRVAAWRNLGGRQLDDCKDFHRAIGEHRWHGNAGKAPVLQQTWAKLLITLMKYKDLPCDKEHRRIYQANQWGTSSGETCVIELSGLAAHSIRVVRDREAFREERTATIRTNIEACRPEFVLLYGKTDSCARAWEVITRGGETIEAGPDRGAKMRRYGQTLIAWVPHPVSHGQTSHNWEMLGLNFQQLSRVADNV